MPPRHVVPSILDRHGGEWALVEILGQNRTI
jgi:hypothetical protein